MFLSQMLFGHSYRVAAVQRQLLLHHILGLVHYSTSALFCLQTVKKEGQKGKVK